MLGLPKSTELSRQLPKKAIYAKFSMNTAAKDRFDADISRITLVTEVSPLHIKTLIATEEVSSFYVLLVSLKKKDYSEHTIVQVFKLFIIDEINRGNLSKIFGELFMLIETDKRGVELQLLYSDEKFSVPGNVYLIGMMNTADRSLAMLDYALRRRFAFFEMKPGFDTDGFREYRMGLASEKFDRLINCVESLNAAIAADESLGEGFCIGHSYFCNLKKAADQSLKAIVEYELIPLLKEYWFDEPTKVKDWANNLRSAVK